MGVTGCCNKSENENTPSTPRVFNSKIFLARVIKRSGGGACPTPPPPSHPRAARTLRRGAAALIRARLQQSSTRRNVETENAARRSDDNIGTDAGSEGGAGDSAIPAHRRHAANACEDVGAPGAARRCTTSSGIASFGRLILIVEKPRPSCVRHST